MDIKLFSKFFKLLVISIILPVFIGLAMKWEAKGRRHLKRQHELLSQGPYLITQGGKIANSYSKDSLLSAKDKFPRLAYYLPIYLTKDLKFMIAPTEVAQPDRQKEHSLLYTKDLEQWQSQAPFNKYFSLSEFLQNFPTAVVLIDIRDNIEHLNQKLIAVIEQAKAQERAMFYSKYGNIVRNMEDLKPHWLHMVPGSDIPKVYLMSQVFLQELAPINFPISYFPHNKNSYPLLNLKILKEIKRRSKHFILDIDQYHEFTDLHLDTALLGIISEDFDKLRTLSDAHFNN